MEIIGSLLLALIVFFVWLNNVIQTKIDKFIWCIIGKFDYEELADRKMDIISYDITTVKITDESKWEIKYVVKELFLKVEELMYYDSENQLICPTRLKNLKEFKIDFKEGFDVDELLEDKHFIKIEKNINDVVLKKISLKLKSRQKENNKLEKLQIVINNHIDTLGRKRKQKIIVDDYGIENKKEWEKEKTYFLNTVCKDFFNFDLKYDLEYDNILDLENKTLKMIDESIDKYVKDDFVDKKVLDENISGIEYEQFCEDILNESGWIAQKTKGSGDQGADIMAIKDSLKIIIQCKKYTGNVGNKAVQEVFSAKEFYDGDIGIVVCSSGNYTKSAKELGAKLDILLLHHEDLASLEKNLDS